MLIKFLKHAALCALFGVIISLSFSISLYEAASVVLVLCVLMMMALERDTRVFRGRWMVFLAVYLAANLLSLTHSHYAVDSLKGITRILRLVFLAISVVYVVDTEEKFFKVFWCATGTAFVIAVDGLVQGFTGFEIVRQRAMTAYALNAGRVTATFRHSNDFSAYLALMFFFFAGMLVEARRLKTGIRETLFLTAGTVMLLACLLWTYCRGAWLAVGAAIFLMAMLKKKKILLFVFAAVTAWVIFFSPPLLRGRFMSLFDPANGTITERKVLTQESLNMIEKSPWVGLGLNTFSDNAPFYKSKDHPTDVQYAHNGFLQMTVETGVIGLLSFLALLLYFFGSALPVFFKKAGSRLAAAGGAVSFGLLAFLIHSLTDTNLHSLLLVANFWLCMGLALAAAVILGSGKVRGR